MPGPTRPPRQATTRPRLTCRSEFGLRGRVCGVENGSNPLVGAIAMQHVRTAIDMNDFGLWKPTPKPPYCPRENRVAEGPLQAGHGTADARHRFGRGERARELIHLQDRREGMRQHPLLLFEREPVE